MFEYCQIEIVKFWEDSDQKYHNKICTQKSGRMSRLLPHSVHCFLENVESSLSLPILIVMLVCTLQLIFCHALDIKEVVETYLEKQQKDPCAIVDPCDQWK